ncbi:MAG: hypothetical protein DRJ63_09185 [Thermoprotei archaeon]|nr:MAG: hypothetical protein DRJ63_09185 [Thermoprotei archaeon]
MSEEKIPWDKVAKEIIKVLGTETARGLYYALISQTLYPAIANAIAQRTRGRAVSEEDLIRLVREEVNRAMQSAQLQPQPTPTTEEELARRIALVLKQMSVQQPAPQPAPITTTPITPVTTQQPPRPTIMPTPDTSSIDAEIKALEEARAKLQAMLYTEFEEEKIQKIKERLYQVEQRLRELHERKLRILQQAQRP